MADMKGWAGKILRVNLSTGTISTVDTMKYKDFIGGMGIGYKVIFDEVPRGTKAFDEANKIIFAVGPITATGAVCAGRTNITTCSPLNPYSAVMKSRCAAVSSPLRTVMSRQVPRVGSVKTSSGASSVV